MNRYEQKEIAHRMPHHIVIVEDEPVTQARLQAYFEQEGYRVSVTASGAGLRDIMEHEHVSLILLDINLPDENGLMLTRSLRERSTVGIILVTGVATKSTVSSGWRWAQTTTSPSRWSCVSWWCG
ncbi:Two-component transcriptional regulator [Salmonella enterica subsp. arizonae]|uniref:Two-component transcriptional regulator n=1 Tax=Salmonella enterica subsp. arizonae TaxID=59203 RepID=A0A2X4W626_SALER|nr:Two-component transcriptional regulator [Salmonella enterica subsp. arizonae]